MATTPIKTASRFIINRSSLSPLNAIPSIKRDNSNFSFNLCVPSFERGVQKNRTYLSPKKNTNLQVVDENKFILDTPQKQNLLNHGVSKKDLLFLIGKGSFGTVLKGVYKGQTVAIKLVNIQNKHKTNENYILHLKHKNIIQILDVIIGENYVLIVMECFKNSKNLQQIIQDSNNNLNLLIIIDYIIDIANGLTYCHENKVLHLDIKPKNILLCEGICKICDFGNSIYLLNNNEFYTHQGTVIYTAPEILKGDMPTLKCDIYSLGILCWQLLFRKNPYEFLDNEVVIYKVVKFNFRPLFTDVLNTDLEDVCRLCWDPNPNLRPNASEICEKLYKIKRQHFLGNHNI